jgi:RNA polymerase sigma-70 factor, ECF subfamily
MRDPDEQELIARFRAGDVQAFERLYCLYYERLVVFVTGIVHDQDAARDVVSDFLLACWERRDQWRLSGPLKSYLFRAVRNRAFNYLRSLSREAGRLNRAFDANEIPGMGTANDTPDAALLAPLDSGTALWTAVAQLNERARTVIQLRWRDQMAHAEIARLLGTTEDAVKKVHQRALATLARLLPDLLD